jgi:hypothetical protein
MLESAVPYRMDVVLARSGSVSARACGAWLHSRYDPESEARRVADEAMATGAELLLFMGLGLGYSVRAALNAGSRVAVVESDPGWMAALLGIVDMSDLLGNSDCAIILCPQGRGLLDFLYRSSPRSVTVVENGATMAAFSEASSSMRSQIAEFTKKDDINAATLKRFGRLWVRNLAKNLKVSASCPGVSSVSSLFKGIPALVLAAGPSLDDVLPSLPRLAERMVLVCVDTALRSVLRTGVQPDFVLVVDPQYWNASHLDRCHAPRSVLVTEAAVWPSVLRFSSSRIIQCSSMYPLGRYVEDRLGTAKGSLGAGGSVATSAWDLARVMGCTPIYMAGLDLSFPEARTHARASLFEQRALAQGTRLAPASNEAFKAMRCGRPLRLSSHDGSELWSDARLSLYSSWFERQATAYPETSFTLSEKGLVIPGMPLATLSSLLSLEPVRSEISSRLDAWHGEMDKDVPDIDERLAHIIESLLSELATIASKADRAVFLAESCGMQEPEAIGAVLEELAFIDEALIASEARDVVGFLLSSTAEAIGGRARSLGDSLEHTARLYAVIAQSARWHETCLREYSRMNGK